MRVRWRSVLVAMPYVWTVVGLMSWLADFGAFAVAALVIALADQVVVLVSPSRQQWRSRDGLVACLVAGLLVGVLAGPRSATLLVPLALACLLVFLGLLQHAATRAMAARTLPRRQMPVDEAQTGWTRDRAALALLVPILLAAVLVVPVATWRFPTHWGSEETPPEDPTPEGDEPKASPPPKGPAVQNSGDLDLDPSASSTDPSGESGFHLEVTPTSRGRTTGYLGPLRLRTVPFVETGGQWRQDLDAARPRRDGDDGKSDGWCDLAPPQAPNDVMDLAIRQHGFQFVPTREIVLPCPPRSSAVDLGTVRAAADGVVLAPASARATAADFHVLATLPSRVRPPTDASVAARGARPSDSTPRELAVVARRLAADAPTDLGRVRAAIRWLREHFRRDETPVPGTSAAAFRSFLATRKGTSIQFAQAAALMLREAGIPARVGTGFVVSHWNDATYSYLADATDWHAWLEVEFQGAGWVPFEPTPGDEVDEESPAASPEFAPPETVRPSLEEFLASLQNALSQLFAWILAHLWVAAIAVAATVLWAEQRRRSGASSRAGASESAADGPWEALLADLARRGHVRRRSETATEFAASVVATGGPQFAPLVPLTAVQQAARFGDHPMREADVRHIEEFRTRLAQVLPSGARPR